jgi:hypothetical protein
MGVVISYSYNADPTLIRLLHIKLNIIVFSSGPKAASAAGFVAWKACEPFSQPPPVAISKKEKTHLSHVSELQSEFVVTRKASRYWQCCGFVG